MDYVVIAPELLYQMAGMFRSAIGSLFSIGIYIVIILLPVSGPDSPGKILFINGFCNSLTPQKIFKNIFVAKLNGMVNAKFSGLGQLYQVLNDFFYKLGDPAPAEFKFRLPDNFLYPGYQAIFSGASSSTPPIFRSGAGRTFRLEPLDGVAAFISRKL